MPSCLGLYIEDNLIKYAKVSKNGDNIKVESFGVKFYETLGNAIKQIVEETYSFKVPISINTTDEWYNEIQVFSLLPKHDMESAIKTEFESICDEKDINMNIYEQRHIFTNSADSQDKIKAIHIAVPKTLIEQRKNQFSDYRVSNLAPLSVAITDLIKKEKKGTSLIVNIEKDTTITKITNGFISNIELLNVGAQEILERINKSENSYAKAYEICKSATIYTETDKDLQYEENEYLEYIMPTLYQIVSQVKRNIDESIENIEKIYITGTGAIINNIDIYFQDYLRDISCEVLKPSFLNSNSKINIKDYIEVNSAIAIALQGIEKNNKNINFKNESGVKKALSFVNSNISNVTDLGVAKTIINSFTRFTRQVDFVSVILLMTTISYFGGVFIFNQMLENKIEESNLSISETNARIDKIKEYKEDFDTQTSKYKALINSIQESNDAISEDKRYKNTIPNLLNNIMSVVPVTVQITSISNPSDTHIQITARSREFQQIAHFKTKLQTEGILQNVVSDTGTSSEGYLIVTIKGELP